jgi:hypothetical protein
MAMIRPMTSLLISTETLGWIWPDASTTATTLRSLTGSTSTSTDGLRLPRRLKATTAPITTRAPMAIKTLDRVRMKGEGSFQGTGPADLSR